MATGEKVVRLGADEYAAIIADIHARNDEIKQIRRNVTLLCHQIKAQDDSISRFSRRLTKRFIYLKWGFYVMCVVVFVGLIAAIS